MVECNFDAVPDTSDFKIVPAGDYVCRVDEVRIGTTRDGSERWALKLVVDRGTYAGKIAAWDGLSFSERGLPRVKSVLHRLAVDTKGTVELQPADIIGRKAVVTIIDGEWTNEATGERILRTEVPFTGYRRLDEVDLEALDKEGLDDGPLHEGPLHEGPPPGNPQEAHRGQHTIAGEVPF